MPEAVPDFTEDQLSAVEFLRRDACVVAGPGSGKTTVLVERYRRLIVESKFDVRHILAITFTEKAAANMKAKLAAQFRHDPERLRDLESAWVSTIHGFCARLLRENAIAAGLDPRFSVLSPRESENLQWECLNTVLNAVSERRREETLELIEALQVPSLGGDLKEAYDAIRSAGMTIEQIRAMPNPCSAPSDFTGELRNVLQAWPSRLTDNQRFERGRLLNWCQEFDSIEDGDFDSFFEIMDRLDINLGRVPREAKEGIREFRELHVEAAKCAAVDRHVSAFRFLIFDILANFDEEYRNRKNALSKVDFNDLERHAIALLKNNQEVRQKIHNQFRQVMLDEFQDINGQQAELIALLRSEDVFFGVGDFNQSIYGFRHARPEIFQRYHEDVVFRKGQSVSLLHNFRSRDAILRCVRYVLAGSEGITDRELVSGATFAVKGEPSIEILKVIDTETDKDAASGRESAWIARRVGELSRTLQIGLPGETRAPEFRDFAVLCRNSESMPAILASFDRAGIPYVCGRRPSFLLSREGLDIIVLLSVVANPRDSISLATLLRGPLVGVSDEGLFRLRVLAGSLTGGLNKFAHGGADVPEPDASRLAAFCANLERWRADQSIVPLDILLSRMLRDCGVDWTPGSITGINIESFLDLARTTGAALDLPAFLEEIESLSEAAGAESDLADEDQGNCVQVLTAHAAKGLEFPVTIIAGMHKGARSESRSVSFTPEHGLGIKWRDPTSQEKDGLRDSWSEANRKTLREREVREENRLLYVAMTRAEEHLVLSWSSGRRRPSKWAGLIENRLNLKELPPASQALRLEYDGFAASILVTDTDPPNLSPVGGASQDADVQTISRPVLSDQHETSVTVTSLAVFGSCPRKYYIQRSLGWNTGRFRRFDPDDITADQVETDDGGDLPASRIGSAVHEILAGLRPSNDAAEARQLADVFLESDLGRRVAASPRVAREWAFIADIDGTILRGTIDLWFEENNDIELVDYKTDDVREADVAVRARDYAPQLALYAIALERALGKRPKTAWLHFLRPNAVVEIPLDGAAFRHAHSLIAGLRLAQDKLLFELNEGEHCRICQFYRSLCPAGRQDAADVILEMIEPDNHVTGS